MGVAAALPPLPRPPAAALRAAGREQPPCCPSCPVPQRGRGGAAAERWRGASELPARCGCPRACALPPPKAQLPPTLSGEVSDPSSSSSSDSSSASEASSSLLSSAAELAAYSLPDASSPSAALALHHRRLALAPCRRRLAVLLAAGLGARRLVLVCRGAGLGSGAAHPLELRRRQVLPGLIPIITLNQELAAGAAVLCGAGEEGWGSGTGCVEAGGERAGGRAPMRAWARGRTPARPPALPCPAPALQFTHP